MVVKKLYYKDYNNIKKLVIRNKLKIPSYIFWKELWDNKKTEVGEGIFNKNKLIGYHSYFKKKIKLKNKILNVLVSSSWVVDTKFRKNSIILLNRYLSKKSDIFLTTTANKNVSKIWKSFGALEVNNKGCRNIFFKVLNTDKFVSLVLKKKKLELLSFFNKLNSLILKSFIKIFKTKKNKKNHFKYEITKINTQKINYYNNIFEKKTKVPHEICGNKKFKNYLKIISDRKKVYVMLIYKQKRMIGYAILVKEKIINSNCYRINLGQIRIENKELKNIDEIFEQISIFAQKKMCTLIEFRNLNKNIIKNMCKNLYFVRKLDFNPYLILIDDKKSNLKKFTYTNWHTSYLDGDCMI